MKRIRIPADVDREDQLLAGLSARQLAVVAVASVVVWSMYAATRSLLPPAAIAIVCAPVVVLATVLVVGRLDGLNGNQLAAAFVRHLMRPKAHVLAPEGIAPVAGATKRTVPLNLDVDGFSDVGVIHCAAGNVMVCTASSVAFRLRTDSEREALTAAFGRFLNGLVEPLQILVHIEPVDLRSVTADLRERSHDLQHPALQAAAREHATFLQSLADRADVMRRTVLLVFRERPGTPDVQAQVSNAIDALSAAGIRVDPVTGARAAALLANAADRTSRLDADLMALPDAVVRGGMQ